MPFAETAIDIPAIMALSIPLFGIGVAIVAVIAGSWRKAKVSEHRAVLVQNMIDKGFSPGEIVRVLEASDLGADPAVAARRRAERV